MAKYDGFDGRELSDIIQSDATSSAKFAADNGKALRCKPEQRPGMDYRLPFAVDGDRILHSRSYTRYIDKTQVFYLLKNDHISHRVLHVQFLSKIARTIGRYLKLNEDLIEAIAYGHDIGHAPFGHDGEAILTKIAVENGLPPFLHNVWSVRFLDVLENGGKGLNLCLETLDGILSHDGEIHTDKLIPEPDKSFEALKNEIHSKLNDPKELLTPMTLEACLVRMADTVSYIGRDMEDAVLLGLIKRDDIPFQAKDVLGDTMGTIVYTLVTDIIINSAGKPYVAMSRDVSDALRTFKAFNLNHIYLNPRIKFQSHKIEEAFKRLFDVFLSMLRKKDIGSRIFIDFVGGMEDRYLETEPPEAVVIDYLAGMTDQYFVARAEEHANIKLVYETNIPKRD